MAESQVEAEDRTRRRAVIKKLAVGSGVVWAAPLVAAVVAPSSASAQSSCACTIEVKQSVVSLGGEIFVAITGTVQVGACDCAGTLFYRARFLVDGNVVATQNNSITSTAALSGGQANCASAQTYRLEVSIRCGTSTNAPELTSCVVTGPVDCG